MNGRALVIVQKLDRVFNGDDVASVSLSLMWSSKAARGGRLSGSAGSGDQNQAHRESWQFAQFIAARLRDIEIVGTAVGITRITTAQLPR